jgi:hypothetical protein
MPDPTDRNVVETQTSYDSAGMFVLVARPWQTRRSGFDRLLNTRRLINCRRKKKREISKQIMNNPKPMRQGRFSARTLRKLILKTQTKIPADRNPNHKLCVARSAIAGFLLGPAERTLPAAVRSLYPYWKGPSCDPVSQCSSC